MSETKTVYRISEVLGTGRLKATRLALIHFAEMADEEQRSELEAVRSLLGDAADPKLKIFAFLEGVAALDRDDRQDLASQLREDFRNDLLSGLI